MPRTNTTQNKKKQNNEPVETRIRKKSERIRNLSKQRTSGRKRKEPHYEYSELDFLGGFEQLFIQSAPSWPSAPAKIRLTLEIEGI